MAKPFFAAENNILSHNNDNQSRLGFGNKYGKTCYG